MLSAAYKHVEEAKARIVDPVKPDIESRGVSNPEEMEMIYKEIGAHRRLYFRLSPQPPLGRNFGLGDIPEVIHKRPFQRPGSILPIQATELPCVHSYGALALNRFSAQCRLSHKVMYERFAKPLVLITERLDEGLPVLIAHRCCEVDPSVLEINEVALVAFRKVWWHRTTLVAFLPDIL